MKLPKLKVKRRKLDKKIVFEDLRYLQKKISGSSVYKNSKKAYFRNPKHRKMQQLY